MTDLYGEAKIVIDYLKSMNQENERAMRVHQSMMQESIDYVYKLRGRNKRRDTMSTRESLKKLQNPEVIKKLKDPSKTFKQIAPHIDLNKIHDQDTKLMVGALIALGSQKADYQPMQTGSLIDECIERLFNVHQQNDEINKERDFQLQHQLHDALSMFDVVDSEPHDHYHDNDTVEHDDAVELAKPDYDEPAFLRRGGKKVSVSPTDKSEPHSAP